jgi:hypothetical protein
MNSIFNKIIKSLIKFARNLLIPDHRKEKSQKRLNMLSHLNAQYSLNPNDETAMNILTLVENGLKTEESIDLYTIIFLNVILALLLGFLPATKISIALELSLNAGATIAIVSSVAIGFFVYKLLQKSPTLVFNTYMKIKLTGQYATLVAEKIADDLMSDLEKQILNTTTAE